MRDREKRMPRRNCRSLRCAHPSTCQCGMKAASSLPRRRRPVRYSSETATGGQHLFLSLLPAPTAWANVGRRLSNPWTQGQRKRRVKGTTLTARPKPASPKPPPRASQRSCKGRDGRRFRKPGARGCRLEQSSGSWESTEARLRNIWRLRVLRHNGAGRRPRRQHLVPSQSKEVTFILNSDTPMAQYPAALDMPSRASQTFMRLDPYKGVSRYCRSRACITRPSSRRRLPWADNTGWTGPLPAGRTAAISTTMMFPIYHPPPLCQAHGADLSDKKSHSTFSCPISWYSRAISAASLLAFCSCPLLNTPAAPAVRTFFQT